MGNTTDLALIESNLKKEPMLEWYFSIQEETIATPLTYEVLYSFGSKLFCAYYNDFSLGDFKTKKEAKEACQIHYDHFSFRQPEPFWKPAKKYTPEEDCTIYDICVRSNIMTYRIANCHYKFDRWYTDTGRPLDDDVEVLAFAEIPPCEVQS